MSQEQGSVSKVFPLEAPNPDFQKLSRILAGKEKADRVHFVELLVDREVMQFFLNQMGRDLPVSEVNHIRQQKIIQLTEGKKKRINLLTTKEEEVLIKSYIDFLAEN